MTVLMDSYLCHDSALVNVYFGTIVSQWSDDSEESGDSKSYCVLSPPRSISVSFWSDISLARVDARSSGGSSGLNLVPRPGMHSCVLTLRRREDEGR